jgi:hypothetical protein
MQVPKTQQFPVRFAIRAVRVGWTAAREAAGEIAILFPASLQLAHRLFPRRDLYISRLFPQRHAAVRRLTAPPARAKGSAPETGARRPPCEAM